MQHDDLALVKLSSMKSADYLGRQAGFLANFDSYETHVVLPGLIAAATNLKP
jgi:hypothetical protein